MFRMAEESSSRGMADGLWLWNTRGLVESLDSSTESEIADALIFYVKEILIVQSESGNLGRQTVIEMSLFGLELGKKFVEAEVLFIEAMANAAQNLKHNIERTGGKHLNGVHQELISRIRQQNQTAPGEKPDRYRETVMEQMRKLGEPENDPGRRSTHT